MWKTTQYSNTYSLKSNASKKKSLLITRLNSLRMADSTLNRPITKEFSRALKSVKETVQTEFRKQTDKFWTNQLKKINHRKADTFFPNINNLLRRRPPLKIDKFLIPDNNFPLLQRSKCNLQTANKHDNNFIFPTPQGKLNILGAHYESINSPRYLNEGTRLKNLVDTQANLIKSEFNTTRQNNVTFTNFTSSNETRIFCNDLSLTKILKALPNKSSSGPDLIPPIVLKHLPNNIIKAYTIIFNNSLNHYYFPKSWKNAKVIPIPKKGKNLSDPASNRPISLAPSISKVYKVIINQRILIFCSNNNLIPDNQFGFKFEHSTCRTFDGNSLSSETFLMKEGLQQGTVNSPILFNIFTSKILNLFDLNSDPNTSSTAFADDYILYVSGNRPTSIQTFLEELVEKVNNYYMSWNLRLNPLKCETILFHKPTSFR